MMYYLSRSFSLLSFLEYGLLSLAWILGGWMLARQVFELRKNERVLVGTSLGFILFITLANLLAAWMPVALAFWLGALGVLLLGGGAVWTQRRRRWIELSDLRPAWPQLAALAGLTLIFELIQRSLAIFDEYLHLPLVSTMAAGNIPPQFYVNPAQHFAYHYALQVWAASLIRQLGLYPWSAWDLAKAFAIALTLVLGWAWVRRLTGSRWAAGLGTFAITFGGGSRWLLLLRASSWLASLSNAVTLINTGADTGPSLQVALFKRWATEGGGPVPFPFAFHNGVFVPVIFILGSTGALPFLTILLLLLLLPNRRLNWPGAVLVGLVLANLALSAEHLFVFLWIGMAGVLVWAWFQRGRMAVSRRELRPWALALGLSALLCLIQGGFITEVARGAWLALHGLQSDQPNNAYGFSLRWPPAVYSAHLGILSLFNWKQILVLVAELGPAVFLAGLVSVLTWRALRAGKWVMAALGIAAWINMLFPLLIQYGVDRSITRMPGTALWLWLLVCLPFLWWQARQARRWRQGAAALLYMAVLGGGLVIFAVMLANIPYPQLSYFIATPDAQMSRAYWNQLEPGAQVLDSDASRGVTVFGRVSRANASIYVPLPDWQALISNPDPVAVARAGYSYIYMDGGWWKGLTTQQQQALEQACVRLMDEKGGGDNSRRLYNVKGCR